ncbi:class I adenylate-forming enzyme family protein [Yoonia sp. SS1-5]|uniref:Class I adenylate-forming enzyme family protein n=1 Tax=Yoonia rhodophyticola TaxID=3137370 RepID=A0AAN0NHK5_9RHOB
MLSVTSSAPFPAPPAAFNMAAHVFAQSDRLHDKPALILAGRDRPNATLSFRELAHQVRSAASGLLEQATPGDHVLLQLGNSTHFPIFFLGAIAAGLVPVVVSAQLTAPELAQVRQTVTPKLTIGQAEADRMSTTFGKRAAMNFALGDPDRPAYIVFTSGTSGTPRAVVHAHRAIWARQMMWQDWYGLREDDRVMHAGAFNWTYTLGTGLMDPWSIGATALIPTPQTDLSDFPAILAQQDVTIFAAAPGVYRRILRADFPRLPQLRHGLSAGEKLADDYRADWEAKTGTTIHEAFGMSECSTFISGSPGRPAPPGTSGFPQRGRQIAIIADGSPVQRGTPGTIAVHRTDPGLMLGYLGAPDETAAKYQGDWFLTGDIGIMDDAGAITYAGRADDMMNAGGYRVSPIEVEAALVAYPPISEAAACAVQVRTGTFIIAAFYVATDVIDEEALRSHMHKRLAGYKQPRLYIGKDMLPRGANNKLLRRVLRTQWEAENGQT